MAKKKSFEESLAELERIVGEMESGTLSLESAVKKYEQGIKLSQACQRILDATEQKISNLSVSPDNGVAGSDEDHD